MVTIKNHTDKSIRAFCIFCGSTVGQVSDATGEIVSAVYDCPKCQMNYCDQCSYEIEINGSVVQACLRCDSKVKQVMP